LSSSNSSVGRPPKYRWELLLDIDEKAPCGLRNPCKGVHAAVWQLYPQDDYMCTIPTLQSSMHERAIKEGLRVHTRRQKNSFQVQFYKPTEGLDGSL
jgi:hypothetical protein